MMTILVTGGAGYIGSVVTERLIERGYEVVVLDNLSTGHKEVIESNLPFYKGDIADPALVERIIQKYHIQACIHFAGFISVAESVMMPANYYQNNVLASLRLFQALAASGVQHIVFSSTAAVYGEPTDIPIQESAQKQPTNPYGRTKLAVEWMLRDLGQMSHMTSISLRYFNAAGATKKHGELHEPESHLIPRLLDAAQLDTPASIFGDDYPTPDGTAIRDYIHVVDLAEAHVLALEYLSGGGQSTSLNLGTGHGYSVEEVVTIVEKVTGRTLRREIKPRRVGDPTQLVADPSLAEKILSWSAQQSNLASIIESAWQFKQSHHAAN